MRSQIWHQLCYGPNRLRFLSVDEKPLYMCAQDGQRVLTTRGQRSITVAERKAMTRLRLTGMTACPSWELPYGELPKYALLFKADDGTRIMSDLSMPADADAFKVQFAPKGSYRTEQFCDYVDWVLPDINDAADAIILISDWASAHLSYFVEELIDLKGHWLDLKIGGCITPDVQVPDVIMHKDLNQSWLAAEQIDTIEELRLRPTELPMPTRQKVVDRAWSVWKGLDHSRNVDGHWRCGVGLPLDGSGDQYVRKEVLDIWAHPQNHMADARTTLIRDLTAMYESLDEAMPVLDRWKLVRSLLEKYDDHRGMREGEELFDVHVDDDDNDDAGDDDQAGPDPKGTASNRGNEPADPDVGCDGDCHNPVLEEDQCMNNHPGDVHRNDFNVIYMIPCIPHAHERRPTSCVHM